MTTAASFTSLHAPLADDNMEMSSPAHPIYDDDIDIDFDEHIGGVELTDDDRMADDTEQPRPGTATDDMMEDDAPVQTAQAPEQEMQDDFDPAAYEQGDPDDELIDYDDEEYQDMSEIKEQTVFEPVAPEITLQDREPTDPGFEQVDEETVREPETSAPAQEVVVEEITPEIAAAVLETSAPEVVAAPVADESFAEAVESTGDHNGVEIDANAAADDVVAATDAEHRETTPVVDPVEEPFPELPEDSPEVKAVAPVPAPIETDFDASNDVPATPTDTGLHPMFVKYSGCVWPLFKSKRQPEGLLKDDNLASVALADLLNSCRSRLALKAGVDISEDQEFALRFDRIGLTITENSPSAFDTSLDEVLAVWKQLHVNDGVQSIPPFSMKLLVHIKPSSYLAILKQAAAGGQVISEFAPEDDDDDEFPGEDYGDYYEDGDEDPTLFGHVSGIGYGDQAQDDGHQPRGESKLNEPNHNEYDTSYENTEGDQEPHDGHDQYDHDDEAQQAEFEIQQAEYEAQQAVDDAQQAEFAAHQDSEGQHVDVAAEHTEEQSEETEDTSYVVADTVAIDLHDKVEPSVAPEATNSNTGEAHDGEYEDQNRVNISNVESAAISTRPGVDQANDANGDYSEYKDEDLIDWNDSTLTTRPPEHDANDNDNFPNFLAENDIESADVEDANEENQRTAETDNTNVATGDEYNNAADGYDYTVETAEIDFEDDDSEHHAEDADKEAPAKAVDVVANGDVRELPKTQASANDVVDSTSELHVATEAEQPQAKVSPSQEPARNDEDYIDFDDEDGIDFDDDTFEEHEARKASETNTPSSKSPSGKRPLDEAGDAEQPELKKVKSS